MSVDQLYETWIERIKTVGRIRPTPRDAKTIFRAYEWFVLPF